MNSRYFRLLGAAGLVISLLSVPHGPVRGATSTTHIVFTGCAGNPYTCHQFLVLDDSGGSNPVPITDPAKSTPGGDDGVAYSPDATRIAFSRNVFDNNGALVGTGIFVIDADGANETQVTIPISYTAPPWTGTFHSNDRKPTWSPDGTKIALRRYLPGHGTTYILIADLNAAAPGNLTTVFANTDAWVDDPDWSPNGDWIAFTASTSTGAGLLRIHPDGTGLETIVSGYTQGPAWSPDGSQIAYHNYPSGGAQGIYIANADGSNQHLVKEDPKDPWQYYPLQYPQWSPDATRIAVVYPGASSSFLAVVNTDGSNFGNFVNINQMHIGSFDWEPTPAAPPTDTDSDGVPDDQDNCPGVANADQADDDTDLVGNACDPDFAKLSIGDASTDEGNVGTGSLSFQVTMTSARAVDVTVQYQTASVTAIDGSDYTGASSVLTISAGETTATIHVAITRDVTHESDETFTVELFNATDATIDDGLATGTIVNDDAQVCLATSPLLEYRFNGTGTTSPSTGTDTTPVTFKHPAGTIVDLHSAPGSGVSGQAGDTAFDNTQMVNDGVFGSFGLGGYGSRAEHVIDDENIDGLASVTFQGWFKSNDPQSVTGNTGVLFNKADGVVDGGGFASRWGDGKLSGGVFNGGSGGGSDTPAAYFSGNQWIFFAITFDGTSSSNNLRFYQGTTSQAVTLVHTATIQAGTILNSFDRLALGNGTNAVRAFPAFFDNMRIFGSKSADSGALTLVELEAFRSADVQNSSVATVPECDSTPPTVTPTVTGTEGNDGWYVSDVTVTWSVVDSESSISSSTGCDETSITTDTAGITLTCSATSVGGTTTESVTIKRDATAPIAVANSGPPPNANGWRKNNVNVSFTGTDALSGIASCDPTITLSTEGTNLSASGRCYDAAGNASAPATVSGINIDKTTPTISIASPVQSATYNRNQVIIANYSCSDLLSGAATCTGSVANGAAIDTSKKAPNAKFIVTAVDKAGNTVKVTITYTVK